MRIKSLLILLGFISILSQTVLLREMLMEVNGNEIVFSVYLSLWLALIAGGSYFARIIKKSPYVIPIVYSLLLFLVPLQFYFIRKMASALTLVNGQVINLPAIMLLGSTILAPGCLLSGFLFPHLCNQLKVNARMVHLGYVLECCGIIAGSIIFVILVRFIPPFSLLCLLSLAGYIILYLGYRQKVMLLPLILFLILQPFSNRFYRECYSKRYLPQKLLSSQDSHYGRLDVTEIMEQKNYYWNGVLLASGNDEMYAQQMVDFVLLQHPAPVNVLMAGGLLNGCLAEMQSYDVVHYIDYLEMDSNILQQAEPAEKVDFIRTDPVRYVQSTQKKYDLIFIDLPDPSSLYLNRFYTREFFQALNSICRDSLSTVAITLSSGANYMTSEIINLNATIYHTFSSVFSHTVLIPSLKNIFLGSNSDYISNQEAVLRQRLIYEKPFFSETVIFEKCNDLRINSILNILNSITPQYNTFSNPRAYLSTILLWTDILDLRLYPKISFLQSHLWLIFFSCFLLISIIGWLASLLNGSREQRLDLNIFSVSLVNFVMELVLINLFQMQYGYVYFVIFLFSSSFMLGLVGGFLVQKKRQIPIKIVWLLDLILILSIYFLFSVRISILTFFLCNIAFGFLEGLLSAEFLERKAAAAGKGSTFYFMDSLGAMTGGLIFSIFLIPLAGLQSSLLLLLLIIVLN